ncbi:MAG TPA: class I SAM-dependent methyltransferase [Acidimicrobiales bacterium]|nr:class I SAM-dependent methyltransferase [Acidimicrobiales bacterium]
MPAPVYDEIGVGYARYRRPDPRIGAAIHAALGDARRVLNVGAGTGSYEPLDRQVVAVEPSPAMIRQRSRAAAPCVRGDANALPFDDGEFDAAMAVLTVHHWAQPEHGLRELRRVANGIVVFTFDPGVHNSFWLFAEYVPAATTLPSTAGAPQPERIAEIVNADRIESVLIPHDCRDGFGCAYWRRPHSYLDAEVRRCISALQLLEPKDVLPGIERLRADLDTGVWQERHGRLLEADNFDGGLRLVVRDRR